MCAICGCSPHVHGPGQPGHHHDHASHDHPAHPAGDHDHHGQDHHHPAGGHSHDPAPAAVETRIVRLERDILEKNNTFARENRALFASRGILALNLVSSPGAGKTTLLVKTIQRIQSSMPVAVIEGDQETALDAERIRATGVPALQINTGKGCHLDAHMVGHAVEDLSPQQGSLLLIENVGNLVCPASFDLGEAHKVVVLSVTEGEDKPLKYPDMFRAASLMLLNKCDLLPHVEFNVETALENARRVNPRLETIQVSATRDTGIDAWLDWIGRNMALRLTAVEA